MSSTAEHLEAQSQPSEAVQAPSLPQSIEVLPWSDAVVDELGHDPRSHYVETFWLGVLGPSTTWLLRHIADCFDEQPDGFHLELAQAAGALGLGSRAGKRGPFYRSIERLCQFKLARFAASGADVGSPRLVGPSGSEPERMSAGPGSALVVRRFIPPVTQGQIKRLPHSLQDRHRNHLERELADRHSTQSGVTAVDTKARRLALTLLELGESIDAAERQLRGWRIPGPETRRALSWARERHSRDAVAATGNDAA